MPRDGGRHHRVVFGVSAQRGLDSRLNDDSLLTDQLEEPVPFIGEYESTKPWSRDDICEFFQQLTRGHEVKPLVQLGVQ